MGSHLTTTLRKIMGRFFALLYTRLAFLYDLVAWSSSMGQWSAWRRSVITDIPSGNVLELGHGPGHLLIELLQHNIDAVGIDSSKQMSRLAHRRLKKAGHLNMVVRAKAQALPFANRSFEHIVCTFPSEYFVEPATLSEAQRVLTLKGTLRIVGIVNITGRSLLDRFADWLYTVTGQSGAEIDGWTPFFDQHGYNVHVEQIDLGRSLVTRFIARPQESIE